MKKIEDRRSGIVTLSLYYIVTFILGYAVLLTVVCLYFQNFTQSHIEQQPIGSDSSSLTVLSTQLHPGTVYIFTLTVHKAGRRPASVTQTVSIAFNLTPSPCKGMFYLFIIYLHCPWYTNQFSQPWQIVCFTGIFSESEFDLQSCTTSTH